MSYKLFCPDNNFRPFAVYSGIGASYTMAKTERSFFNTDVSSTTSYSVELDALSNTSLGAEVGGMFIFKRSFVRFLDFGFNYRQVSGGEQVMATRTSGGDVSYPDLIESEGQFKYHRASVRINMQSVLQMGEASFFHLGPGLTITETLGQKSEYEIELLDLQTDFPNKPSFTDVNMMAGIGFRVGPGRFFNIYAHTSVMSLTKDEPWATSETIYNSMYKNSYIGFRFIWVKGTPDRVCPAMSPNRGGSRLGRKRLQSDFYPW
ncbi:MAG: hypothetical protein HKN79_05920 [Flavobacteriales bacterium]|nr:hypothetical protein [Flavobacteriales bacterium]